MKSWISKALLGLCLTAPSAMALLPTLPGKYAGIYMNLEGFGSIQRDAIKNGMGLWLLGMRGSFGGTKFRVVSYPEAPNTIASVTIEKVNAPTSNCTAGMDPRQCAFDISYSYQGVPNNGGSTYDNVHITVYTQNAQGGSIGLPLGNSSGDQISFQNFVTYLCRLVLDPSPEPSEVFGREYSDVDRQVVVPWACGLEMKYNSGLTCGVSWGNPYYRDGLIPIVSFRKVNSTGTIVGRATIKHQLSGQLTEPGPGWILTSARYLLSEAATGGKSISLDPYYYDFGSFNRIGVGDNTGANASCYLSGAYGWLTGYSASAVPTTGSLGTAANNGLNIQNVTRVQTAVGDAIASTYPASCQTTIGFVGDLLLGD